jgi:hypothetical protein
VRYVQLFDWGWDFHGTEPGTGLKDGLTDKWAKTDRPIAALIRDLKQRGMLDDTLIVCGGEFGRTPFREGRTAGSDILGRDHYPDCFTMWLAGGAEKEASRVVRRAVSLAIHKLADYTCAVHFSPAGS